MRRVRRGSPCGSCSVGLLKRGAEGTNATGEIPHSCHDGQRSSLSRARAQPAGARRRLPTSHTSLRNLAFLHIILVFASGSQNDSVGYATPSRSSAISHEEQRPTPADSLSLRLGPVISKPLSAPGPFASIASIALEATLTLGCDCDWLQKRCFAEHARTYTMSPRRAGRARQLLVLLSASIACLLVLLPSFAAAAEPGVSVSRFAHLPSKISYFDDSTVALYHDATQGIVFRSEDEGKSWSPVSGSSRGKAAMLVPHPFDKKQAFILSRETRTGAP